MKLRNRQMLQTATVTLAVALVMGLMFKLLFDNSLHVLKAAVAARSGANARIISSNVNFALASGAVEDAHTFLAAFAGEHPEARAIAVLTPSARVISSVGDVGALTDAIAGARGTTLLQTRIVDEAVTAVVPVRVEESLVGYVVYGETLASLLAYRDQVLRLALVAFVLLLGLIPLVALLSFRQLIRALTRLSSVTRRAQQGDLSARVVVQGSDEVAQLSTQFNTMLDEIDSSRKQQREQERLRREMELAERVQTSLLPPLAPVDDLRLAAQMLPASEVGGDYYDMLRSDNGCWFAIGDVSGHGLSAGLVMIMAQTAISTATARDPGASPSEILTRVNRVVHDNVRGRWGASQHMTLTLLRYCGQGRFVYAGAHEDLLVWSKRSGSCQQHPTQGPWIGAIPDISAVTSDSELELQLGDRLVLFTDGITEARGDARELFGIERLCTAIEAGGESASAVVENIVEAVHSFTPQRHDDQTVVVIERHGG